MIGIAFFFPCRQVPVLFQNVVAIPEVGEKDGVLPENQRHFLKQELGILLPPSANMESDNLPVGRIHHQPDPLFIGLATYKAPHLISLAAVEFIQNTLLLLVETL